MKSIIKSAPSKALERVPQFPVPDLDKPRYDALKNIILQVHLSCLQPLPDDKFIDFLIISWNANLRRIPTQYLEPSSQFAIENHNGVGKITCSVIYRAFRELLLRQKNSNTYELPVQHTAPPKEYYELLAKIGIFPKPIIAPEKTPFKKVRPQYKIEKRAGQCCQCTTTVKILVIYQDKQICLDCAIRAEIIKKDPQ